MERTEEGREEVDMIFEDFLTFVESFLDKYYSPTEQLQRTQGARPELVLKSVAAATLSLEERMTKTISVATRIRVSAIADALLTMHAKVRLRAPNVRVSAWIVSLSTSVRRGQEGRMHAFIGIADGRPDQPPRDLGWHPARRGCTQEAQEAPEQALHAPGRDEAQPCGLLQGVQGADRPQ